MPVESEAVRVMLCRDCGVLCFNLVMYGLIGIGILIPFWVTTYHGWDYWLYGLVLVLIYGLFILVTAAFVAMGAVGITILQAAVPLATLWLIYSHFGG
ncbi:MAG: hypothetical protein RIF32_20880 [Leptospirales bacterium]|jgi:hypothetical protein